MSLRNSHARPIVTVALWGALAFAGMVAFLLVAVASVRRDVESETTSERTNADKRKAVTVALGEFGALSDRQIAELCGVGHQLVATVRNDVDDSSTSHRLDTMGRMQPATKAPAMKHEPRGEGADIPEPASETLALLQSIDREVAQLAQRSP